MYCVRLTHSLLLMGNEAQIESWVTLSESPLKEILFCKSQTIPEFYLFIGSSSNFSLACLTDSISWKTFSFSSSIFVSGFSFNQKSSLCFTFKADLGLAIFSSYWKLCLFVLFQVEHTGHIDFLFCSIVQLQGDRFIPLPQKIRRVSNAATLLIPQTFNLN